MLRYISTDKAANSNRSGNNANGPSPYAWYLNNDVTRGLEVKSFKRKTDANIISPNVNSDRVLMYILT